METFSIFILYNWLICFEELEIFIFWACSPIDTGQVKSFILALILIGLRSSSLRAVSSFRQRAIILMKNRFFCVFYFHEPGCRRQLGRRAVIDWLLPEQREGAEKEDRWVVWWMIFELSLASLQGIYFISHYLYTIQGGFRNKGRSSSHFLMSDPLKKLTSWGKFFVVSNFHWVRIRIRLPLSCEEGIARWLGTRVWVSPA